VIELQDPLDKQFLDLGIREGVSKTPADSKENDLGGKMPPFEARRSPAFSHDLSSVTDDPRLLAKYPKTGNLRPPVPIQFGSGAKPNPG
jgi:hypothetical protein